MSHPTSVPTRFAFNARLLLLAVGMGVVVAGSPGMTRAQAGQPRVTIVVSPDLDSVPAVDQACPGCDGRFTTSDALRGNTDPLPPLVVKLLDHDGRIIEQATTQSQQFGSQMVSFAVAAPGDFAIEVATPDGWEPCAGQPPSRKLTAEDFGATGAARIEVGFWHGCLNDLTAATRVAVAQQNTVTSTAAVTSPLPLVPPAAGLRLPQTGTAVESSGRLMFGLAAAAVTFGLLGLAFESGMARRS